ncbi:MAG: 2-oxoacid:acceptor oxidoreductase family protein, partial [bacterium]
NDELSSRVFNIIILGIILKATNVVPMENVKGAMECALGKKFDAKPELRELNYKALERGMQLLETSAV